MHTSPANLLSDLPFLKAAIEDCRLALRLASSPNENPRQSICFMHDALEFLFYEVLLAKGFDIYSTGQNTIGFDAALDSLRKFGVNLPLIGTIRAIQKQRGDAKHHAQVPNAEAFQRITPAFSVVFSVIGFEAFGQGLAPELLKHGIYPLHLSLYDLFRRARNHDWDSALSLSVRALIHKRRSIYSASDDYSTHKAKRTEDLMAILDATGKLSATPEEAAQIVQLVSLVRASIAGGDTKAAAEAVGEAFSGLDFVSPTLFDIKTARRITRKLYQPKGIRLSRGMAWIQWESTDPQEKEQVDAKIGELLKSNAELVKAFGQPHYDDGDRYWKWWEFVVFVGSRWHSFHLDDSFSISLESLPTAKDGGSKRVEVASAILEEFANAVEKRS